MRFPVNHVSVRMRVFCSSHVERVLLPKLFTSVFQKIVYDFAFLYFIDSSCYGRYFFHQNNSLLLTVATTDWIKKHPRFRLLADAMGDLRFNPDFELMLAKNHIS